MLSIAHTVTGAFIATTVPNPLLSVPLIFASHYLEDWIPHWDVGTGLSSGKRKRSSAILLEIVELSISVGLIYFFWQYGNSEIAWNAWFGFFMSLLPDFMEAPRNFLKWEPRILHFFNELHGQFHHSTPNMALGLLPQIIVVGLIAAIK